MIDFLTFFNNESGILVFGTSNLISSKGLKPLLPIFKTLHIFSLTATLTPFGTSVPSPYHFTKLKEITQIPCFITLRNIYF